ncbi:hypothetical protein GF389_04645 [Candidatus Dojkabacteria bacterium]|nr:hypothetical protein [Candidatus Dojkabacteria bacterium]
MKDNKDKKEKKVEDVIEEKLKNVCDDHCKCCRKNHTGKNWGGGGSNAFYGLGFIGALIYFIGNAANLGEGLFGIVKAILWPAYFVYYILESMAIPI